MPQTHPHPDVDRVLLDEQQIRDRLAEIGAQIAADKRQIGGGDRHVGARAHRQA